MITKRGRPRGTTQKVEGLITTNRRVLKNGKSLYICLPKDFVKKHDIQPGEPLPIVANSILKIIPTKEIG